MIITQSHVVMSRSSEQTQAKDSYSLTAIARVNPNRNLTEDDIEALVSDKLESEGIELNRPFNAETEAVAQHITRDTYRDTVQVSNLSNIRKDDETTQLAHFETIETLAQKTVEQNLLIREVRQGDTEPEAIVGVQVLNVERKESHESVSIETLGSVQTADGREIDFAMALDFQRNSLSQMNSEFIGNRDLIDPLMINLEGNTIAFSDTRFSFDLNADGQDELIAKPADGTGFLVFDKNGNGVIDDGSELFGPQTGAGFSELAAFDSDGNGWIDENDQQFSELKVMTFNGDEVVMQDLITANVGALYVGSVEADYSLMSSDTDELGNLARSGFALSETGQALYLQEFHFVDLSTPQLPANENPLEVFQQVNDEFIADRNEAFVNIANLDATRATSLQLGFVQLPTFVFEQSPFVEDGVNPDTGRPTYVFQAPQPAWERDQLLTYNHQWMQFEKSNETILHAYTPAAESVIDRNQEIEESWTAPEAKRYRVMENLVDNDQLKEAKRNSGRWQELLMLLENMREKKTATENASKKLTAYRM